MKTCLFRIGRVVLPAYLAVLLLVGGCQNRILYQPRRGSEAEFTAAAQRRNIQPWRDAQGRLLGWHRPNPRAAHRLVVFHGNAGCALDRSYYLAAFEALGGGADWEVRIFEYPGYGPRPGSPGRAAFIPAGRAALQELLAADSRAIFLLGESIGSGTACALAAEMPGRIAGLALVVPFARLQEVAQEKFRWLPAGLLLRDKFDNIAALASYRGRIAVVIADEDEVVGAAQGRKLHGHCREPRLLITLAGAGHNSIDVQPDAAWFRQTSDFLLRLRQPGNFTPSSPSADRNEGEGEGGEEEEGEEEVEGGVPFTHHRSPITHDQLTGREAAAPARTRRDAGYSSSFPRYAAMTFGLARISAGVPSAILRP